MFYTFSTQIYFVLYFNVLSLKRFGAKVRL